MKKLIVLMIALTVVLSLCACGGQPAAEQKAESEAAVETESKEVAEVATESAGTNTDVDADKQTSDEVTQEQIEENIIGRWMATEKDGESVLTNDKNVYTFESPTKAYLSASLIALSEESAGWSDRLEADVEINNNEMSIIAHPDEKTTMTHSFVVTNINDNEFSANHKSSYMVEGKEVRSKEDTVRFIKVNEDYSEDILGTWEGHCTSKGSVFDDGQEHRWEYKDDGTYVYYVKDRDTWVPSDNELNEYFVAGNLLCTRWIDDGTEYREWWEITIDGDTMNWTALREDEDGKEFTVTFEMKRVNEEKEGLVIKHDGNAITVAWDEIDRDSFEGDLVNEKGEASHGKYEGAELRTLLAAKNIEVSEDSVITVTAEDGYSAELTGAEILEKGKVYVALSQNDEMIEGSEGGQGAQMIVFGDPNSRRAVRYLKMVSVSQS